MLTIRERGVDAGQLRRLPQQYRFSVGSGLGISRMSAHGPEGSHIKEYAVDSLVKRIASNDIVVPRFSWESDEKSEIVGFQREYVWPPTKAGRFVESLLLLPVPGIFRTVGAVSRPRWTPATLRRAQPDACVRAVSATTLRYARLSSPGGLGRMARLPRWSRIPAPPRPRCPGSEPTPVPTVSGCNGLGNAIYCAWAERWRVSPMSRGEMRKATAHAVSGRALWARGGALPVDGDGRDRCANGRGGGRCR